MSYTDTQAQSPLIINQMPTATYEGTTKSSSEVYVVTDPAGKNMNNLTDTGYSVLNNSKALETGAVCSDKKIYNDVYNYAHSTYDSSKFTTHGTVSVTNDGIASGFSASNYLTFTAKCGNVTMQVVKFNVSSLPSSAVPIGVNTYFTTMLQYVSASQKHFPLLRVSDGNNNFALRPSTVNLQANTTYIARFTYNSSTYELGVYLYDENGTLLDSKTQISSYNIVLPTSQTTFAMGYSNDSANLILDLKQVYMISDGIPVFSGNKTGIDTIKPDDYTIVGTPTISADGVATNFSASNNINSKNKFTVNVSKDFEVRLKLRNVLYQDGLGDTGVLEFRNINSGATRFSLRYNGKTFYLVSGGSGNNSYSTGYRTWTYTQNFDIDVVFGLKGTSFYGKFKRSYNDHWITLDTTTIDLTDDFGESYISIGTGQTNFMSDLTGSIDLNGLQIYVNGNLVYQPCLKIPYTKSSDKYGSKIVDSVYRPRVTDTYNQGYPNRYYTIDEVNKNFTLPMGEIYGMIQNNANYANTDFINNSKALETGTVCDNEKIYNDVYNYAHSTFDLSKFVVTGNPMITNDGILSNITTSNYVRGSYVINNPTQLRITGSFTFGTDLTTQQHALGISRGDTDSIGLEVRAVSSSITTVLYATSATTHSNLDFSTTEIPRVPGIPYYYEININGTSISVTINGVTKTANDFYSFTSTNIYIGLGRTGTYPFLGSIDLKRFSVIVGGYPVFSGNKTGLDVIKPDDYTVVGTPTILSDGIVTGFTASNYLMKSEVVSIGSNDSFRLDFNCKSTVGSAIQYIACLYKDSSNAVLIRRQTNNAYMCVIFSGGSTVFNETIDNSTNDVSGYAEYKNGSYTFNLSGVTKTATGAALATGSYSLGIGARFETGTVQNALTNGSVDLNGFRIYTNDNLIYQPCLKIPYTQSKTGSKIVDVVYRDRVVDMYEQFGDAPYYTIDAVNKNFTLPKGEVYGLIETTVERNQLVTQSLNVVQNSQNKGVNENIFNSLTNDFHSTFDLSRFIITGTPIITDDGIASGFGSGVYAKAIVSIPQPTTSFREYFRFKIPTSWTAVETVALLGITNDRTGWDFRVDTSQRLRVSISNASDSSSWQKDGAITSLTMALGSEYYGYFEWDGTTYNIYAAKVGEPLINIYSFSSNIPISSYWRTYGAGSFYTYSRYFGGSIDLKYTSIFVDGIPVFSGNKTGIDTIKPDDYTVVGTPTISADGILSTNNSSNYIDTGIIIGENPFRIVGKVVYSGTISGQRILQLGLGTAQKMNIYVQNNTNLQFGITTSDSTNTNKAISNISGDVLFDFEFTGTKYELKASVDGGLTWSSNSYTSSLYIGNVSTLTLYIGNNFASGIVDLNSIKVYVNGNLVYQPCLKIPYINSKDGKKMVYSVYRPRVQDCYKQFGQANYTVIDEENKEYFLPLGSASGFYGKRVLVDSYRNGINYWEIYSDGTIEQGGSCTSGTAVNLLKPFADTNYVVTVPYSAKTKTSFTPTQTGDWIAKGQGSL